MIDPRVAFLAGLRATYDLCGFSPLGVFLMTRCPRLVYCRHSPSARLQLVVLIAFRLRLSTVQYRFWTARMFPVVRVFSSTLLPGFIGPESSVLSADLPPSVPARFGVLPMRSGFMAAFGNSFAARSVGLPRVRHTSSPYPVQLHPGSLHRISGLA